jgi:hypothetical protein
MMGLRKIWNHDDTIYDLFDSVTIDILWWPGFDETVVLSDISVWLLTGHSTKWHDKKYLK